MMKKYNKPEIVTLALDAVDVIETSAVTPQVRSVASRACRRGDMVNSSLKQTASLPIWDAAVYASCKIPVKRIGEAAGI